MTKFGKGLSLSRRLIGGSLLMAGCWMGAYASAYASAAAGAETTAEAGGPPQSDASGYAEAWGPPLGTRLPMLAAQDQDGQPRSLEDLAGRQGLLLFLHRSADW